MTTKKTDDSDLTRRQFTGLALGAGAGAATLGLPGDARAGEDPFRPTGRTPRERPNVLFIIADDLGWADLSSFGATDTQTPNIDRMPARDCASRTPTAARPSARRPASRSTRAAIRHVCRADCRSPSARPDHRSASRPSIRRSPRS